MTDFIKMIDNINPETYGSLKQALDPARRMNPGKLID